MRDIVHSWKLMDRSKSINWLIRNCDSIRTFALWNYLSNYYGCTMLSSSCMDFNLSPWKKNCIFLYIYNLEENWKLKNIEIQSRYMNMLNTRMIETNKLKLYGRVDCIKTFFFFFYIFKQWGIICTSYCQWEIDKRKNAHFISLHASTFSFRLFLPFVFI